MTETYSSLTPLLAVMVPLAAVVLIIVSRQRPNLRESWTIMAALAQFALVASMMPSVLDGRSPETTLFTISPGIALALRVDWLGIMFGASASFLWILTSVYSIGYVRGVSEHKQTRYFGSFAVCLAATMGIAFSANLFTLVIFYEILSVATYPLVVHKETPEAVAGGRKYLVYALSAGVTLLLALALTYYESGSVEFVPGGILAGDVSNNTILMLFGLFLVSFGVKSAVMPLHSWLPTAMVAPTPVSALLHAVAVVKAGIFGLARAIGFIIGPLAMHQSGAMDILAGLAAATIVIASLIALRQDNLKARLAYSTVGHLSYIVLGMSILSVDAWTGGLMHMVNHAVMKITLFFCAGAIYVKVHLQNVSDLNGIGRQMPLTMGAFAVASLGLAGFPPIVGFISKWFLVSGTLETGQWVFAGAFLISGLLNAGYLFSIVVRAFFAPSDKPMKFAEASPLLVVPLIITAVLSVVLGLFQHQVPYFYQLASWVATSIGSGGGM